MRERSRPSRIEAACFQVGAAKEMYTVRMEKHRYCGEGTYDGAAGASIGFDHGCTTRQEPEAVQGKVVKARTQEEGRRLGTCDGILSHLIAALRRVMRRGDEEAAGYADRGVPLRRGAASYAAARCVA